MTWWGRLLRLLLGAAEPEVKTQEPAAAKPGTPRCRHCGRFVRRRAVRCRNCGSRLS